MKRIVVCMDGTWQRITQPRATNVNLISRSVAHQANGVTQFVIYTPGVGTTLGALQGYERGITAFNTWLTSTIGGLFGEGLEDSILDTYLKIAFNYEPGDELFIFGFSRGAYSARSLAGMIGKCGIVRRRFAVMADDAFRLYRNRLITPDSPEAVEFRTLYGKRIGSGEARHNADYRPPIAYLGIFDTVGMRGLPPVFGPFARVNKRYAFHDLNLGKHVHAARHAVAIDERRSAFPPTLWENFQDLNAQAAASGRGAPYQQRWFAGAHGDVGGGNQSTLSTFPLEWVVEGAELAGLVFDRTSESPLTLTLQGMNPAAEITRPSLARALNPVNWPGRWRRITDSKDPVDRDTCESALHTSVAMRTVAGLKKPYAPPPLKPFRNSLTEISAGVALIKAVLALMEDPPPRKKVLGLF